jgi:hypothetical protein
VIAARGPNRSIEGKEPFAAAAGASNRWDVTAARLGATDVTLNRSGRHFVTSAARSATDVTLSRSLRPHSGWCVTKRVAAIAAAESVAVPHVVYLAGRAVRRGFQEDVRCERMGRLTHAEREELEALGRRLDGGGGAERDRSPLYAFPRADAVAQAVQADWKARLDAGIEDELRRLDVPVLGARPRPDRRSRGGRAGTARRMGAA